MKMRFIACFCTAAALASAPSAAQGIIPSAIGATVGNMAAAGHENDCLSGKHIPSAEKVAAARAGADAAIAVYLAVAAAPAPVDVSPAFTRRKHVGLFQFEGKARPLTVVDDPLARALAAGSATLAGPHSFTRASDGRTASGVWSVHSGQAAAAPLGHYRAVFRPEGKGWRLTRLELTQGSAEPTPATQYCHVPGDVEIHLAAIAEWEAKRAEKKAAKEAERAARASR